MTQSNDTSSVLQGLPAKAVIFDLDGTILDTESLVIDVAKAVCERHGKHLTAEAVRASLGKRPVEAWQAVADVLGLERTAQELFDESEALLIHRWHLAPLMPGAQRLLSHLQAQGVPLALATSTSRASLQRKLSTRASVQEAFVSTCCGDEVTDGKPAPECFLRIAQDLSVPPASCLVIEDSPSGVEAAIAAGMRVVAVPSMTDHGSFPAPDPTVHSGCVSILPSLLDFQPQQYGLPPFSDYIGETIPMSPVWRLKGPVIKGFGRGSKDLGIPTANLDPSALAGALADAVTGIFAGWASVGDDPAVYKTALSIGFNPVFQNKEKTVEPWILHEFGRDFHGEEIRLIVCAYIRPESNFPSLEALVERIRRDAAVAEEALNQQPYISLKEDTFLKPSA